MRAMLSGCAAALLMLGGVSGASAAPDSREQANAAYQEARADEQVDPGWTGSVEACEIGTESDASLEATRRTVNVLRWFAGLGPVAHDPPRSHRALAAALMMHAENDLDHEPGPGWACYTPTGRAGAETSNLALGYESGAGAAIGYVDDSNWDGTLSGLGHRFGILNPEARTFGSGSTGYANALSLGDHNGSPSAPADLVVSWPPAGFAPWPWVFPDWSVTIGNWETKADLASARVSVTLDGSPLPVSDVRVLANNVSYGNRDSLAWSVDLPSGARERDGRFEVAIAGARLNGSPFPISYGFDAFAPSDAGSAACDDAKAERRKAKARRSKLARKQKRLGRAIKRARSRGQRRKTRKLSKRRAKVKRSARKARRALRAANQDVAALC